MALEMKKKSVDSLGHRMKFGVVAPSTNTSVQPEFDDMRPRGVTNHFSRIDIPIEVVMSCQPDHIVMGMSSETFWDGLDGSKKLQERMETISGLGVSMGSDACQAALKNYGDIKRLGIITPYMPIGDSMVRRFFTDCGFEVVHLVGLKCDSPVNIAHVSEQELRDAFLEVNDPSVEALVQVGTNLACARVAAMAEFWLDKPVLAINTATYWWALRSNGIMDKVDGFGSLLLDY